jgi:lipoyl(octanoyl) transferase
LNVTTNLADFQRIIPCGIRDHGVTSMERLLGRAVPLEAVAERTALRFAEVFRLRYDPDRWVPLLEGAPRA